MPHFYVIGVKEFAYGIFAIISVQLGMPKIYLLDLSSALTPDHHLISYNLGGDKLTQCISLWISWISGPENEDICQS